MVQTEYFETEKIITLVNEVVKPVITKVSEPYPVEIICVVDRPYKVVEPVVQIQTVVEKVPTEIICVADRPYTVVEKVFVDRPFEVIKYVEKVIENNNMIDVRVWEEDIVLLQRKLEILIEYNNQLRDALIHIEGIIEGYNNTTDEINIDFVAIRDVIQSKLKKRTVNYVSKREIVGRIEGDLLAIRQEMNRIDSRKQSRSMVYKEKRVWIDGKLQVNEGMGTGATNMNDNFFNGKFGGPVSVQGGFNMNMEAQGNFYGQPQQYPSSAPYRQINNYSPYNI